ncbi:hypothetical protein [Rummeliibacillus suwonensis]|nr:hypothetical protein [Rummeliibacillus suwonensis]
MASFIATVGGMFGLLIVAGSLFVHYLRVGLDSSTSHIVDPKPKNKF